MKRFVLAGLLAIACGSNGGEQPSDTSGDPTGSPSTSGGPGSASTTASTTSADGSTGSESLTMGATEAASTSGTGSSGGGESSTGEPAIQYCGLEDLKPGAPNPIVSGTEPGMIPPDIAEILLDNCGCHYADMLTVQPVPDYSSMLPLKMDTWEEWQGIYGFPGQEEPTLDGVLARIEGAVPELTMPHLFCYVGEGEQMDPTQRQILIDWIVAGGPDGATWMPE